MEDDLWPPMNYSSVTHDLAFAFLVKFLLTLAVLGFIVPIKQ